MFSFTAWQAFFEHTGHVFYIIKQPDLFSEYPPKAEYISLRFRLIFNVNNT